MNEYVLAFRLLDQLKVRGFEVKISTFRDQWEVRIDKGLIGFHTWGQLPDAIFKAFKNVETVYGET